MIGTALMVGVIGRQSPPPLPGYMPWEVDVLENGSVKIFGITLGKTRIQDANQILSSFPEVKILEDDKGQKGVYAIYDNLNIGGFIAKLTLEYDLTQQQVNELTQLAGRDETGEYLPIPQQQAMELLTSQITSLKYEPEVDYDTNLVLQHFGQADEITELNDSTQQLVYADRGLNVVLNDPGIDSFIYQPILTPDTTEE